jgi:hypothetical protein
MLAHLVSGRWGDAADRSHPANVSQAAQRGWFSRFIRALFGKSR